MKANLKQGVLLLVEDDPINREMMKDLFEDVYEVVEAENGEVALRILRERAEALSAIILDLFMPVMDGYALLEEISRNRIWAEIPIIISTSEVSIESDQRLLDLGVTNIMHKPVDFVTIKKQVANVVSRNNKRKKFMAQYLLMAELLGNTTKTFFVKYNFVTENMDITDSTRKFLPKTFVDVFSKYPFETDRFVLTKDLSRMSEFMNVKEGRSGDDEIEIRLKTDVRQYEWFKVSKMVNYDTDNKLDSVVFLFKNIEYEIEAKNKLVFMAINDQLTHIPNIRTFSDSVKTMLNNYPEENFLMITMDIAQFHMVNKMFGYSEGDNVLKYFATKLQEIIECYPKGVYCRMASDIFYACLSEDDGIDEMVASLQNDLNNYPISFELKPCFGIYRIEDKNADVETMIEHSSYARLELKKNLILNVRYYDEELKKKEYLETYILAEMEHALETEQFEIYLQPKCSAKTNRIIGSEALIRWNSPEKGFLSPGLFIPIFEANGFITALDYFVYEAACKTIRRWLDQGIEAVPISVNVSRCDLYDKKLLSNILNIVERYQIPHDLIEFEITESAFVLDGSLISEFSQKLRENGFHVLIDDFGSGYSALNSLRTIHVDVLKIDIKFLPLSSDETKAPIILAAVIDMAKKLGFDVITEGVETEEQLKLLTQLGCENVQGYYYYKPMPVSKL